MIEGHQTLRYPWGSFVLLVGLTMVGYIVAGDLHIQASGPTAPFNLKDLNWFAVIMGFLFGAVSGLTLGMLQWLILKSWIPGARLWIALNAAGFGLVHALNDALPYRPLPLPLMLVMGGVIVGLAQSVALRHALSRALAYLPLAAIAWYLGFQLGFAMLKIVDCCRNPGDVLTQHAAVFGTAGLIFSAITGLALMFMAINRMSHTGGYPHPSIGVGGQK